MPVDATHVLMFARAVGDAHAAYGGKATPDGVEVAVAPPTFVQAATHFDAEYAFRPAWEESPAPAGPSTFSRGGPLRMHAEQHFEYGVPIRAGDVLTIEVVPGSTWEKEGRAGKLVFRDEITEYHNQRGELAVRARAVIVTVAPAGEKGP